jgi:hypothetical protein
MSPTPPTLNPSQTVERIREIIVGRHLERLEGRVSRLESAPVAPTIAPKPDTPIFEDRLLATEAKIEAFQDHVHRIDGVRHEVEQIADLHRQEAQQLALRIQRTAKESAEATAIPAVESMERKLGAWLTEWQRSLQVRLEERDQKLAAQFQADLMELRDSIESRIEDVESRVPRGIEERFDRIASAARVLAESAASFSTNIPPKI